MRSMWNVILAVLVSIVILVFINFSVSATEDFSDVSNGELGAYYIANVLKLVRGSFVDHYIREIHTDVKCVPGSLDSTPSSQIIACISRDLDLLYSSKIEAKLLYEEGFEGTSFLGKKWGKCPEWERQGGSVWDDDMSYLDGGYLVLRAEWDESLDKVRCGAVRTIVPNQNYKSTVNKFGLGYYEALIKFPLDATDNTKGPVGIWCAFWMMCGDVGNVDGSSADGVEIDIIESIHSENGAYNTSMNWDGYGENKKYIASGAMYSSKIYDGEFHKIALERTEKECIFYIDGEEIWRITDGDKISGKSYKYYNCVEEGYMKLTIESAPWAYENSGMTKEDMIAALGEGVEMLVDYVRVYDRNPYR